MITEHFKCGLINDHEYDLMKNIIVKHIGTLNLKSTKPQIPKGKDLGEIKFFTKFPLNI